MSWGGKGGGGGIRRYQLGTTKTETSVHSFGSAPLIGKDCKLLSQFRLLQISSCTVISSILDSYVIFLERTLYWSVRSQNKILCITCTTYKFLPNWECMPDDDSDLVFTCVIHSTSMSYMHDAVDTCISSPAWFLNQNQKTRGMKSTFQPNSFLGH